MKTAEKLTILADAAKYDASCASSGSNRKAVPGGIGNAERSGICHSWSADGRCVSLLKILLSNDCLFDCSYCLSRRSNDLPRATFTPQEVADLTINFYLRNYFSFDSGHGASGANPGFKSNSQISADEPSCRCRLKPIYTTALLKGYFLP